jgi:F-type H+-transporting ATPase subunit a
MSLFKNRFSLVAFVVAALLMLRVTPLLAQDAEGNHGPATSGSVATEMTESAQKLTGKNVGPHAGGDAHDAPHGGEEHGETPGTFDPHAGTWLNPITRAIFGLGPVQVTKHDGEEHFTNIKYDFIVIAVFIMLVIAIVGVLAARAMKLRPDGKPMSLSHIVETSAEGYRNYLIGVMGEKLGTKYAPLVSSFFFTILLFNWMGLVPGMLAPTANPNVPVALAIVAFFCTHFIAIRETGLKSWFMHFVGEPVWLAPLNFPLHLVGELIKPLSLSIRLLCNVFGEEMVALQLALLAVGAMAVLKVPIPFHLPMLLLGTFFGLLQALVFSTLLAIYIAILSVHHDEHDEHNLHGSVEHVDVHGFDEVVAHPSQTSVA